MTNVQNTVSIEYCRCVDCGKSILSEKKGCPKCGSFKMERKTSSGRGTVINSAITYFPPKSYESLAPYTSVFLDMHEGFKMFGIMEGEIKDLPQGSSLVAARVIASGGAIVFERS